MAGFFFANRQKPIYSRKILVFILLVSLAFWIAYLIGALWRWNFIEPLLTAQSLVEAISRGGHGDGLREQLILAALPWNGQLAHSTWIICFADLLLLFVSCLMLSRKNRFSWIVLTLVAAYVASFFSRGSFVGALVLVGMLLARNFPVVLRRSLIILFLGIPVFLSFGSSSFLNGRRVTWTAIIQESKVFGHGIGAGRKLATAIHEDANGAQRLVDPQHPHNIHLEFIHDFGWFLYGSVLIALVTYLLKLQAWRTAWVIFFVCSVNYSLYSPWILWLMFFALKADLKRENQVNQGFQREPALDLATA